MKLLHTADWHLGKHLEGKSRLPEQEAFIDDLVQISNENDIDMILITGDIFDTYNPSAAAESLFYRAVSNLASKGERIIAVISGNHDSPGRLKAPSPLAFNQGILIMDTLRSDNQNIIQGQVDRQRYIGKHKVLNCGEGFIELEINGEEVVLLALPYPSESRLNRVLGNLKDERIHQESYSTMVGEIFRELEQHFRSDAVNIAASHIFVAGGSSSKSERPIQVGGGLTVSKEDLPEGSQYTALGHLHNSQVACRDKNAYYSGSPLQYSLSEKNQTKSVSIVELQAGRPAQIEKIYLKKRKPIEQWVVDGIEEALEKCRQNKDRDVWAYLKIKTDKTLLRSDLKNIKTLKKDILSIIPITAEEYEQEQYQQMAEELDIMELFKEYYHKTKNNRPDQDVMDMLVKIIGEGEDNEAETA